MLFDNYSTQAAKASLDYLWLNTKVITNNLANESTPGFKAQRVSFDAVLTKEAQRRAKTNSESGLKQMAQENEVDVFAQTNTVNEAVQARPLNMSRPQDLLANKQGQDEEMFRAQVRTLNETSERVDGNNVSLEREEIELARTNIQYNLLMDKLKGHYSGISTAISNMKF